MDDYKKKVKNSIYSKFHISVLNQEGYAQNTTFKIVNNKILDKFRKNNVKRILEAGCGDGRFLLEAKKAGMEPYGFDSNFDLVSYCKKRGIEARYASLSEKLPYKDSTFDGIYCTNVIEHTEDPDFAIYELYRILKPRGLLIILVPDIDYTLFYDDWTHIKPFTIRTMENLAVGIGIKKYKVYMFYPPILVKYWNFPPVRWFNLIISVRPIADIINFFMSRIFHIYRHYIILEASK